jgi:hypothetical protein
VSGRSRKTHAQHGQRGTLHIPVKVKVGNWRINSDLKRFSTYLGGSDPLDASPRLAHAPFLRLNNDVRSVERRGFVCDAPLAALRIRSLFMGGKFLPRGPSGFQSGDSTMDDGTLREHGGSKN